MVRLLGNDVLLRPRKPEEKKSQGGVILPADVQRSAFVGIVVAVGDGLFDFKNNKRIPMEASVGDRVLYNKFSVRDMVIDGEDYVVVDHDDLLAILDPEQDATQLKEHLV